MKKPKKSTAAKPRSPRRPSNGSKLRAKTAGAKPAAESKKAQTKEPMKAPVAELKKSPVKRVRKTVELSAQSSPPAEAPRPIEVPPVPVAKAKRGGTKSPAVKSQASVETAPKPKTESIAGLAAETKPVSEKPLVPEVKRASRPAPLRIPPILLEGDKPSALSVSGPGERYALGPTAPVEKLQTEGELPASYGTGEILLTARDPHWLYTHWDLSDDQQRHYNAYSRDGHLIVRVYIDAPSRNKPAAEVHVHPESRHWFLHVAQANTRYVVQLGYYSAADKWTVISTSSATLTPPDAVSPETTAEFATIPFDVPMEKLLSLVKEAVQESAPLARALEELRVEGHPGLPQMPPPQPEAHAPRQSHPPAKQPAAANGKARRAPWKPSAWTPAQERALAQVISMDHVRRVWMGSLEITELIRRQVLYEFQLAAAGELGVGAPTSPAGPIAGAVTGISSLGARAAQPLPGKGSWFNVNAELIVYGATEPDATVTIGGRKIKLRPDGSFSYRFALPDGNYEMPVVAISADQTDGRAAEMKFSRGTEYRGHVGAHPQDPSLRQLLLENF